MLWPFASGLMLLWGLAAAVPIAIHLWSRRRYQEVPWAAMEYLLAALRKNARRIRIEQLLLLAVRVAILLMLAVALAEPFWPFVASLAAPLGFASNTHWVLVVDGSYSMDYRGQNTARFETAKEMAAQIVSKTRQGDGFTLVLMGDPPRAVIGDPAFSAEDVRGEIERLQMPHGGANLTATMAEVEAILAGAADKYPRLSESRVCIFSDMGRNTWDAVQAGDCKASLGRIAERSQLALFDLGQAGEANLAVVDLQSAEPITTVGRGVALEATVQNFGPEVRGQKAELYVDGQLIGEQTLDSIADHGQAQLRFTHQFETPGEHDVEVRLAADRLPVDNRRFLSLPVRESIRALCVEGRAGSARLIAYGLDPFKSPRPHVRWEIVSETALLERDLDEYDCVFLCNVGRFGPDDAAVLADFLAHGGGLVFFLGDQVQIDSYNEYLGGDRRVLPARLVDHAPDGQYFLDPLDYRHVIMAAFRGNERAGLFTLPTYRYVKLEPYNGSTASTALAFSSGDPALIEEKLLGGRSLLFATAGSEISVDRSVDPPVPWTVVPTWRNYPALIQEILPLAVSRRDEGRNVLVGQPIGATVPPALLDAPLFVAAPQDFGHPRPSGGELGDRVPLTPDGVHVRWSYIDTRLSGIFEARFDVDRAAIDDDSAVGGGRTGGAVARFVVNVDTRESNLERFDPDLLPSQFRGEVQSGGGRQTPVVRPPELFRPALATVLLLLLLETLLAWLFASAVYGRLRSAILERRG
jgi:hypothetical protein